MRHVFVLFLCYACGVAASPAAIDLTPALTEYTSEGILFRQLIFSDGKRQITYELPPQWSHRATGGSLKLNPPGSSNADVVIQARPLSAPQLLDENGIALVREHFIQGVPPTSQAVKVLGEGLNTVPFKAGATYEITASYQALGEVFTRRSLYVNLPETQLIFRLTARKNEFESLWRTFRSSILSWQWVAPTANSGPKTALN